MLSTKVTRKGQITIPVEIRKEMDIREGDLLLVDKVDGNVLLINPRDIARRTAGVFAKYARHQPLGPDEERRMFEEGVAREVAESLASEG